MEFLNGVKVGAFSGDDEKKASEAQVASLQNVLNIVANEPGAGLLKLC